MHEKLNYEIPEAELLVVRFEGNFMESNGLEDGNRKPFGAPSRSRSYDDGYDFDETNY